MTWMLTAQGHVIDIRFINNERIDIRDIAKSLSLTYRYNGMTRRPISVAEHSLVVADIMERELGITSPPAVMAALMHDAHEYITGDLSSPMKACIGTAWKVEETRIQKQVLRRFGLWSAFLTHHDQIHHADMHALSTERVQLMPEHEQEWPCVTSHPPLDWLNFSLFDSWTPAAWEAAFIDRFTELDAARTAAHQQIPAMTAGMVA